MTIEPKTYTYGIEVYDPFGDDYFYLGDDEVLRQWLVKPIAADAFVNTPVILIPLPEGYYVWDYKLFRAADGLPEGLDSLKDADSFVNITEGSAFDDKAHILVSILDEVSGADFDSSGIPEEHAYSITQY